MMKNNSNATQARSLSVNTGKVELRTDSEGKKILRGYAVVFSDEYRYTDWWTGKEWTEKVDRHAFDDVDLSGVCLLRDHNFERLLGRCGRNLRIEIDDEGLFYECELPDTELANETYALAEREICDQCSFGFTIKERKIDEEARIETITRIGKLYEITITPIPAYRSTVVVTMSEDRRAEITAKKRVDEQAFEAEKNRILKKIGEL